MYELLVAGAGEAMCRYTLFIGSVGCRRHSVGD